MRKVEIFEDMRGLQNGARIFIQTRSRAAPGFSVGVGVCQSEEMLHSKTRRGAREKKKKNTHILKNCTKTLDDTYDLRTKPCLNTSDTLNLFSIAVPQHVRCAELTQPLNSRSANALSPSHADPYIHISDPNRLST